MRTVLRVSLGKVFGVNGQVELDVMVDGAAVKAMVMECEISGMAGDAFARTAKR